MKARRASLALAAGLILFSGGRILADSPTQLPLGTDVPLDLPGGGGASFDLNPSPGGVLTVQLTSGDLSLALQNDDQSNSIRDTVYGSGVMTITLQGVPPEQPYHLRLSSHSGAQLALRLNPASSVSGSLNQVISSISNVSSSSGSSSSSSSTSSVNVNHQVVVTGNSVASGQSSRVDITNGQVTITSGQ